MDGQVQAGQVGQNAVVDGAAVVPADILDGGAPVDAADHRAGRRHRPERVKPRPDWSFGTGLKTGLVRWGTVVVLLVGPAVAVVSWVAPDQVAGPSKSVLAATALSQTEDSQLAAGAATSLVWTWWSATASSGAALQPLVAGGVDDDQIDQLPPNAPAPPRAVIVQVTTRASGAVWQVRLTVVDSAGRLGDYLVPVAVSGGRGVALTLPAQVPALTSPGDSSIGTAGVDLNTSVAQAVAGFATALLTGGSSVDVARWTSPGTQIAPIGGTPYAAVQLQTLELISGQSVPEPTDGATVDVTGSFIATLPAAGGRSNPKGTTTTRLLQYTLRLAARGGRWEVQAITAP